MSVVEEQLGAEADVDDLGAPWIRSYLRRAAATAGAADTYIAWGALAELVLTIANQAPPADEAARELIRTSARMDVDDPDVALQSARQILLGRLDARPDDFAAVVAVGYATVAIANVRSFVRELAE